MIQNRIGKASLDESSVSVILCNLMGLRNVSYLSSTAACMLSKMTLAIFFFINILNKLIV